MRVLGWRSMADDDVGDVRATVDGHLMHITVDRSHTAGSEDFGAGLSSFMEKRPARFTGR